MKRFRIALVTAVAAAAIGLTAAPASACPPDDQAPCPCDNANAYFERLTGQPRLLNCS